MKTIPFKSTGENFNGCLFDTTTAHQAGNKHVLSFFNNSEIVNITLFGGGTFDGSTFRRSFIHSIAAEGCTFVNCDFRGAKICASKFINCDFRGADFRDCIFEDVHFEGGDMTFCRGIEWELSSISEMQCTLSEYLGDFACDVLSSGLFDTRSRWERFLGQIPVLEGFAQPAVVPYADGRVFL